MVEPRDRSLQRWLPPSGVLSSLVREGKSQRLAILKFTLQVGARLEAMRGSIQAQVVSSRIEGHNHHSARGLISPAAHRRSNAAAPWLPGRFLEDYGP